LFIGETLHVATHVAVTASTLSGIILPDGITQQTLLQYADDTTFSLVGVESNIHTISLLLAEFGLMTGLVYNPRKSVVYWFGSLAPPGWIHTFGCQVAQTSELSKLLGTPFGISLDIDDVDEFLQQKITKKLQYWSSQFLSLVARKVIVNSILVSTLWFFIHVWVGSDSIIRRVRASLRDYLWSGTDGHAIACVGWNDYWADKMAGGLNLIDPDEALVALSSKWILKVMEPGISALHTLLQHRLDRIRPSRLGTWPSSLHWALTSNFSAPRGSPLWNRIVKSWKNMSKFIDAVWPRNHEEVLQISLWWTIQFIGHNFGFSEARASQLYKRGCQTLADIWDTSRQSLRSWRDVQIDFGFTKAEYGQYVLFQQQLPISWQDLLTLASPDPQSIDWFGIFSKHDQ
jgi:hypothetical protein